MYRRWNRISDFYIFLFSDPYLAWNIWFKEKMDDFSSQVGMIKCFAGNKLGASNQMLQAK